MVTTHRMATCFSTAMGEYWGCLMTSEIFSVRRMLMAARVTDGASDGGSVTAAPFALALRGPGVGTNRSWRYDEPEKAIRRDFRFADFGEAFAFMTRAAIAAEKADHHPDWSNSWNKVGIALSTHSAGGVTEKDLALARHIERFTRTSKSQILYEFKVEDPTVYTKPWRGEMPINAAKGPVYEYACHEGNYALPGILSGARYAESQGRKPEAVDVAE